MTERLTDEALIEALEDALAWIDAVPADTALPTMPGFDRDRVDAMIDAHRRAAPADDLRALLGQAVDLIEGDAVGAEWKRQCRAFTTAARAALSQKGGA